MHCYVPGWEIPKFHPEHFTDDYGFITDYLAEFFRELRKEQYGDALDHYFRLGKNLNQRDTIAVRKMVDGLVKLPYPDGEYTKEELEEIPKLSLEMRCRMKEQLKKLGGGKLIPEGIRICQLSAILISGMQPRAASSRLVSRRRLMLKNKRYGF